MAKKINAKKLRNMLAALRVTVILLLTTVLLGFNMPQGDNTMAGTVTIGVAALVITMFMDSHIIMLGKKLVS